MEPWLLIVFTFGVGIFVFLSMVEAPVWSLIFRNNRGVAEGEVRFVHESLQRLTSKLPASNGLVILGGTTLMILQGIDRSWDALTITQLAGYFTLLFIIVAIRRNPATVKSIRANNSKSAELYKLIEDIRNVGIDHHLGLVANLFALTIQLIIWSN